ncbi:MAG: glycosyltransferase family 2 protein [Caldilineaceae bacterium]
MINKSRTQLTDAALPVVGLVMTQKNEGALLPHNLAYHRYLGVSHFYIFDDGSSDDSMASIADQAGVQQFWETDYAIAPRELAVTLMRAVSGNWIARQHLNTYKALQQARADGVDWLLALDADELVALENTERDALRHLCAEASAATEVLYFQRTYEVLPQTIAPPNVFRHARLFKTPSYAYGRRRELLDPIHNKRFSLGFLSHITGKSLARTSADLLPFSSHDFMKRNGKKVTVQTVGRLLHYHFYSAADFINKNRLPHPDYFVYGGKVPYYPKLFWRELVQSGLSEAELCAYFAKWLVFSPEEINELRNAPVGSEPLVVEDRTVGCVWEKMDEPAVQEMEVAR